jgi:hypothetical protein
MNHSHITLSMGETERLFWPSDRVRQARNAAFANPPLIPAFARNGKKPCDETMLH